MKVGGDYGVFPIRKRWPASAGELGLDADVLVDQVRELGTLVPDAFGDAAKASDIADPAGPMPG